MVTKRWWLPWMFFTGAGTLIVYPWFLEPGFLFLLDFVWTPQLARPLPPWEVGHVSSLPWHWLWWILAQVIETSIVQKGAFALPWLLAGVSMYHLISWVVSRYTQLTQLAATLTALSAGIFYLTNPFIFTRAVMGQHYLLLAYALTPWALLAWLMFLRHPTVKLGLIASLTVTVVMLTNAHHLILLPLLLLCFIRRPQWEELQAWLIFLVPIGTLALLTILAQKTAPISTTTFNPLGPWARALQAPHSGNVLLDTVTLTATWKTDLPYLFSYESLPGFMAVAIALLAIMLLGALYYYRQQPSVSFTNRLLILVVFSILLVIGVAHSTTEPIAAWLYQSIPGWMGFRDSAKFLSLLAVGEAILLALGMAAIATTVSHHYRVRHAALVATAILLLVVLYFSSPSLAGLGQQIYPTTYPHSWYAWNEQLSTLDNKPRALFLPWHQYLPFAFTADRTVVNPTQNFFTGADIIAGDNSEVGGTAGRPFIYSESERPLSQRLEAILIDAPKRVDVGNRLAGEHIRYVMLAIDTWDANEYHYLYQQPELELVFESSELVVWENSALP